MGIGSPRASVEANFALRNLVGEENFCNGLADGESELIALALDIHRRSGARIPTVKDVEAADVVLVLGEDVLNTAPRVALSLRQAARGRALEMGNEAANTGLAGCRNPWPRAGRPEPRVPGYHVAHPPRRRGGGDASRRAPGHRPRRLRCRASHRRRFSPRPAAAPQARLGEEFVDRVATALADAKRPLIVTGTGSGATRRHRGRGQHRLGVARTRRGPGAADSAARSEQFRRGHGECRAGPG